MISLRPYKESDADDCYTAVIESMTALAEFMPWANADLTRELQRAWVESKVKSFEEGKEFEFAIVSPEGTYLGGCGLNGIDTLNKRANLGYWVRSSAARRGIATAATNALVAWGFANTDLQRLEVIVSTRNVASLRVAEKAGAVREGVLKNRLLLNGEWHDAVMHAFTRS